MEELYPTADGGRLRLYTIGDCVVQEGLVSAMDGDRMGIEFDVGTNWRNGDNGRWAGRNTYVNQSQFVITREPDS